MNNENVSAELWGDYVKGTFPFDYKLAEGGAHKIERSAFKVPETLSKGLATYCRQRQDELHRFLLSGIAILLDRYVYGDRGEIVLGIPLTVRGTGAGKKEASPPPGIKGVTIHIDTEKSFNELFRQVGEQVSAAEMFAPWVELPFATAVLMESIHDKDS
ncbi:MAG: hypothetical protein GY757_51860, partial [bacterium]|nr:hypothetical protein [bacterium]